ncbi:MAG: hypothetical protein IJM54_03270 [Thermoguttaceae bacterium]|nr:hypothetical protein [Thermoguttaceae bacterium]
MASDSETDALFEKYLEESQKLSEEFAPVYEHLRKEGIVLINSKKVKDVERWEREYYQPLFERSKQAMLRVADCDDYLSMWEKKVPQRIIEATEGLGDKVRKTQSVPYFGVHERGNAAYTQRVKLLTLCELAVACQNRKDLLKDTIFEDSQRGAQIREPRIGYICNPWVLESNNEEKRLIYEKIGLWYVFPPRETFEIAGETTFESSWHTMAIYSFKNERSENILYELINDPNAEFELADWAVYYLALSPNSARFLPHVNKEIQERIVSFQKKFPQKGSALSNLDGATRKPYLNNFRNLFESARDRYISVSKYGHPEKPEENAVQRYLALNLIRRLLILKQSLEFNEKVPENEKERFEIVRRELAISWALTPKETRSGPVVCAGLKKGEERFRIYMAEYEPPPFTGGLWRYPVFYLRDADSSNPEDQWDAKAFYERELARKDFYSEVQIEYIQKQLEIIDKNEKQRIIMEQREREKKRNK